MGVGRCIICVCISCLLSRGDGLGCWATYSYLSHLPKIESHLKARWVGSLTHVCINGGWGRGCERNVHLPVQDWRATWTHQSTTRAPVYLLLTC